MAKPTTGRVGGTPALVHERCYECGQWVDDPDAHEGDWITCPRGDCPYKPAEDDHGLPEPEQPADPEPVPDALVPWLRGVVAYARRQ